MIAAKTDASFAGRAGEHEKNNPVVIEPERQLPVVGHYDVLVAGGGIAGVAAAVAAARRGASVCLLEKTFSLGGLATIGNVIVYLPLCDGMGRKVMSGLSEELIKLSVSNLTADYPPARFRRIPEAWLEPEGDIEARKRRRYIAEFNPAFFTLALEELVVNLGIKVLYDTRACAVCRVEDKITHIIVENKSGRQAISCGAVVDATGDADICFLAGEETESLDANVLCGWFYTYQAGVPDGLKLHCLTNKYNKYGGKENAVGPFFRGDDADDVTAQVIESRRLMKRKLAALQAEAQAAAGAGATAGSVDMINIPSIPCFRMTRRLVGPFSLGERHMHTWFEDAVGLTGDWRKPGPVYAIPLRALIGAKNRNLAAAGRCMSSDRTVWDVTRVIPTCAVTGEAAGTAAAMAVAETTGDLQALPVKKLQEALTSQGVLLDPELVKPVAD